MQREIAINLLCHREMLTLSTEKRQSIVLSWWGIDESDAEFSELPLELQINMKNLEYPPKDSFMLDPLVLLGLRIKFVGVRNEYLEEQLRFFNISDARVEGQPEQLIACPCCRYLTLESRGQYYICPVCFWEDSGQEVLEKYSSPNRMTLAEARSNFEIFGAISEGAKQFVDPHGYKKWNRLDK